MLSNINISALPAPWDPTLHSSASAANSLPYPYYLNRMMMELAKVEMETRSEEVQGSPAAMQLELGKEGFIFVNTSENSDDALTSSSSLTESHPSIRNTGSAGRSSGSSSWTLNEDEVHEEATRQHTIKPPKVIKVESTLEPTCLPYAQLCFDPESKTLVTLMEINLESSTGGLSKRLRLVDQAEKQPRTTDDPNPSGTDSTVSTRSELQRHNPSTFIEGFPTRFDEPIVLSEDACWMEEADLDLYLLHECQDPWQIAHNARGGCGETLKKLLVASKAFVIFKSSSSTQTGDRTCGNKWDTSPEPFSSIGYTFLQEA